jgi:hypothetical protein
MNRNISDLLDSMEYSPIKTKTTELISVEKVKELTMNRITHRAAQRSGIAWRRTLVAILAAAMLIGATALSASPEMRDAIAQVFRKVEVRVDDTITVSDTLWEYIMNDANAYEINYSEDSESQSIRRMFAPSFESLAEAEEFFGLSFMKNKLLDESVQSIHTYISYDTWEIYDGGNVHITAVLDGNIAGIQTIMFSFGNRETTITDKGISYISEKNGIEAAIRGNRFSFSRGELFYSFSWDIYMNEAEIQKIIDTYE